MAFPRHNPLKKKYDFAFNSMGCTTFCASSIVYYCILLCFISLLCTSFCRVASLTAYIIYQKYDFAFNFMGCTTFALVLLYTIVFYCVSFHCYVRLFVVLHH